MSKINSEYYGKKAYIYCRVSSKTQIKEWHWLESQEGRCIKWAGEQWIEVVNIYKDWLTWGMLDRPWFLNMISDLKKQNSYYLKKDNKEHIVKMLDQEFINYDPFKFKSDVGKRNVDIVIIDDESRMVRGVTGWWHLRYYIEVVWWAKLVNLNWKIEDTPEWILNQNILMSFKQYQRQYDAQLKKYRFEWNFYRWYYPFSTLPLWYKAKYDILDNWKKVRNIEIDEDNSKIVKESLEYFVKVKSKARLLEKIKELLFKEKIDKKIVDRLLSKQNLYFYAGYLWHPKYQDTEPIQSTHQPIIDEDLLKNIFNILNEKYFNKYIKTNKVNHSYLLSWYIFCSSCWSKLHWDTAKGGRFFYYACHNRECLLYRKLISKSKLEKEFEDFLTVIKFKDSVKDILLKLLKETFTKVRNEKVKIYNSWMTKYKGSRIQS